LLWIWLGGTGKELPVPATFLADKKGITGLARVNADCAAVLVPMNSFNLETFKNKSLFTWMNSAPACEPAKRC